MTRLPILLLALLTACSGSGGGSNRGNPISNINLTPELVFCRSQEDNPHQKTQVWTTTARGLNPQKISDRGGIESRIRLAPDGIHIAFVREREPGDPESREIFWGAVDASVREDNISVNRHLDDAPCWSKDGEFILYASNPDKLGHRLWRMRPDGSDKVVFHDDGSDQLDPDWSWTRDVIVFSRRDMTVPNARAALYMLDADGKILLPLTDGGTVGLGDFEPAWSPDGSKVVFVRAQSAEVRNLMMVDVGTGQVTALSSGLDEYRYPRWAPQGDRLFAGIRRPTLGMTGLALHRLGTDGSNPLALFPDKRFDYTGFDILPALSPQVSTQSPESLNMSGAVYSFIGSVSMGKKDDLFDKDGRVFGIATGICGNRDCAALVVDLSLGVAPSEDVAEIHVEITCAISRTDKDSYIRIGLDNSSQSRFDTVIELAPTDTKLRTYSFSTASLAHVTREGEIRFEVIGDLTQGNQAELFVDNVSVRIVEKEAATK